MAQVENKAAVAVEEEVVEATTPKASKFNKKKILIGAGIAAGVAAITTGILFLVNKKKDDEIIAVESAE